MLFWASLTSLAVLSCVLAFQGKAPLLLRQSRKDVALSALEGLFSPFLYYLVLFKAYDLLPAQQAQPLNYTWPIVFSVLSAFWLSQRLGARTLFGLVVSFGGVVVVATQGNVVALRFTNGPGCGLALGSSVIWSAYWILNLRDKRDDVVKLATGFAFGTVYVTMLAASTGGLALPAPGALACAGYVGLFEMGITFLLWLKALQLAGDNAAVSHLAYLSPFLSLFFIRFILGETIHVSSVLGLTLIVVGILIGVVRRETSS